MFIKLTTDGQGLDLTQPPFDTEGLTACLLGNKGAGKSNTMAVLSEAAHAAGIPFIYYDPNGDCLSLAELGPDVLTIGYPDRPGKLRQAQIELGLARRDAARYLKMVLEEGRSLAVDLSKQRVIEEEDYAHPLNVFMALAQEHFHQADRLRTPVLVLVDEAPVFAPQSGGNKVELASRKLLRLIAADGRKRGMALIVAAQHAAYLDKSLIRGSNLKMFGKLTHFPDFDAIKYDLPPGYSHPKHGFPKLKKLRSGQTIIVTDGLFGQIQVRRRTTTDLGKTPAFTSRRKPSAEPTTGTQLTLPIGGSAIVNR